MKRQVCLFFGLVLCLCAIQMTLAQRKTNQAPDGPSLQPSQADKQIETPKKARQTPVDPNICDDCDPPPDPPCSNPIDDATFFVQQQYRDFLYREPYGYELAADVAPLNSCRPYPCYNTERVKMSRRMWDKAEFRQQSRTFGLPLVGDFQYELYNDDDFVELEYLIYLQRASSAPPDDYHRYGYFFWLGVLNGCVGGSSNFDQSSQCYNDSINAFLSSTEYRNRFACE
jgi:hypothetical protein